MDVPLPFCLVANDTGRDALLLMPAYWFLHNAYALERNNWKFQTRDRRVHKQQKIETQALAPDTIEEIFHALDLLEEWVGRAASPEGDKTGDAARARGRKLLQSDPRAADNLEVLAEGVEHGRRPVRVLKAGRAWAVYREMVHYYAVRTLVDTMIEERIARPGDLQEALKAEPARQWVNLGGQIVPQRNASALIEKILDGRIDSWTAVHREYDRWWKEYPLERARHALACLLQVNGYQPAELPKWWIDCVNRAIATQESLARQAREARAKDYDNPIRQAIHGAPEEMEAVLGPLDQDPFLIQIAQQTALFNDRLGELIEQTGVQYPNGKK
jgi:hypothetical protein